MSVSGQFKDLTGVHRAVLRSLQFTETQKGNEQIELGFDLLDSDGKPTGQRLSYFGAFSDRAIDYTIDALRACGWEGDELAELPHWFKRGLAAEEVSLTVALDEYNGKVSNRIRWVNRPGGFGKPMSAEMIAELSRRLKDRVRTAGRTNNKAPSDFGSSTTANEDLPF